MFRGFILDPSKKLNRIAWVYPKDRNIDYTLIISLIRVFKSSGIDVHEFNLIDDNNIFNPKPEIEKLVKLKKIYDAILILDLGYLTHEKLIAEEFNCPLILFAGDNPQSFYKPSNNFIAQTKKLLRKTINQHNNYFGEFLGHQTLCLNYDGIITSDKNCYQEYTKMGLKSIWLPYWADSSKYFSAQTIRQFDLTTIMNPRRNRIKTLRLLEKIETFNFINGKGKFNEEAADFYRNSKVIFNKSNYGEITIRIFEAMACGALLITDKLDEKVGLDDLFQDKKDLVYYHSDKDLINKVSYFLEKPSEREKIALSGFKKVMKDHTEFNRANDIYDFILQLIECKK